MQDAFLIGQYNNIRMVRYSKSQLFVHGDWHKLCFKNVRDCRDLARGYIRLLLAIVQTEEIQKSVEHLTHTLSGLLNILDIHTDFIRIAIFSHQSGITSYCRQRCTQFMCNGMYGFFAGSYKCLVLPGRLFQLFY